MRILFRVWINEEVYYLGDEKASMFWEDGKLHIAYLSGYHEGTDEIFTAVSEGFILEQYTGLKDKSGVKIFEGDIIESFDSKNKSIRHEIRFDDASFVGSLNGENEEWKFGYNGVLSQRWIDEFKKEVIGNIHENPELLD